MTEREYHHHKNINSIIPDATTVNQFSDYIEQVSLWTDFYKDMMWPRSPEKIKSYFQKGHSVLLINDQNGELLAHGAIKWISQTNPILEIGTVVVNPKCKGLGFGTEVTKKVIEYAKEAYPEKTHFAFCNQSSLGLFKKLGAIEAQMEDLPSEVWDGCAACPNKPKVETGRFCCDTIVYFP